MNKKPTYNAPFYDNGIFHVYNRTNNKELLFRSDDNRIYFLKQYFKYLHPFADTFCWNLLPNHFHFLTRVKTCDQIKTYLRKQPIYSLKPVEKRFLENASSMELLLECEWKRFFNSYSMSFNKQHGRSGNLFHRPFKRLEIIKESHFTQVIIYIHANAQKHRLCNDFTKYPWSSWHAMISNRRTRLCRNELLDWFGGLNPFIEAHTGLSNYYYSSDAAIEDED